MSRKFSSRTSKATTTHAPSTVDSLAIVGLGYVGLPLALLAEERGLVVRGFDIDTKKIAALRRGFASYLSHTEQGMLKESTMDMSDEEAVLEDVDAYIICVPTPVDGGHEPDLEPLLTASESVGRALTPGALVVIESTVNPGACEKMVLPILEKASGLRAEKDFYFAHCPERINPGDARWDVRSIPRVIGAHGPQSLAHAVALYERLIEAPIERMGSIKEAEAVKMVENSFRDVNIAFVNELAMSFSRAGIDITNVLRGAATKPFSFMPHSPGCGVGGHCIPVDPYYLIRYGRENGFEHRFLVAAREINNTMPAYTAELLQTTLAGEGKSLRGAHIALLGLAYKPDVPDLRESPALAIRDELVRRGALVRSFDPYVLNESSVADLESALSGADAALIATDHRVFHELAPETFIKKGITVVVDGRNCLPKDRYLAAGLTYRGIGR